MTIHETPIHVVENATAYYSEGGGDTVRHEGKVEIYDHWIRLIDATGNWVPREQVEQVHEL